MLEQGAEECVIQSRDDLPFRRREMLRDLDDHPNVDEVIRRIRGRLEIDHAELLCRACLLHKRDDVLLGMLGAKAETLNAKLRQDVLEQMFGAAIDWFAGQKYVARFEEFEDGGADRSHAAVEHCTRLGSVPHREPVFQYLKVRIVDAAVDEPRAPLARLAHAMRNFEEFLPRLRILEHERRCLEDGTFDGTLRPLRPIAVSHHQSFRFQRMLLPVCCDLFFHVGPLWINTSVCLQGTGKRGNHPIT